ncbi:IS110 family transposase [Anabaena sp. UHCC 0451]|uniref:IS110 family transposase n=1 Tax=Anabaena sp. UHCC 0451 TaxID=2055235 RepID=UPI002B1E907B|nr:transposase [Anabaena sp. UHCC 0451]MEA5579547.1 transposase [Anabaena sp. UHCC 0451]
MRIIGLDVSKSSVSCCLLESKPSDVREFYYDCRFHHFQNNQAGISGLLALKPDVAILEPTGVNYSKFWTQLLTRAGVEIRLVGHKELRRYRENHLGLPDKDDDADSLAIACYYFDYCSDRSRWVRVLDPVVSRIRELILRLNHLNKVQSPIINRARQDLAWQFPEVALVTSKRSVSGDVPLLWGWLAGERKSKKYDQLYAKTAGLGLTDSVKFHSQRICSLQREEQMIEDELSVLLKDGRFAKYIQVFEEFNFGDRLQATIISQIFPLENFFGEDGKPSVKIRKGRISGKPTKRYLSLRRFQKALGYAPTQESSGDISKNKVSGGSAVCRKAIWQWVFSAVEPARRRAASPSLLVSRKIENKDEFEVIHLGSWVDKEKKAGVPVALVRSRAAVKAVKLLFKKLVNVLG